MTTVPLKELPEFARNVMATLAIDRANTKAVIIALKGELGSGKTTFVQTLARNFGITEPISSPTYVLMKKYKLPEGLNIWGAPRRFKTLIHIDAYRLENPKQFKQLKPEDFLNDPSCLVFIEWPERLAALLPTPDVTLHFSEGTVADSREIQMQQ